MFCTTTKACAAVVCKQVATAATMASDDDDAAALMVEVRVISLYSLSLSISFNVNERSFSRCDVPCIFAKIGILNDRGSTAVCRMYQQKYQSSDDPICKLPSIE